MQTVRVMHTGIPYFYPNILLAVNATTESTGVVSLISWKCDVYSCLYLHREAEKRNQFSFVCTSFNT